MTDAEREKAREYGRKWRAEHKAARAEYMRQWYDANREKQKAAMRKARAQQYLDQEAKGEAIEPGKSKKPQRLFALVEPHTNRFVCAYQKKPFGVWFANGLDVAQPFPFYLARHIMAMYRLTGGDLRLVRFDRAGGLALSDDERRTVAEALKKCKNNYDVHKLICNICLQCPYESCILDRSKFCDYYSNRYHAIDIEARERFGSAHIDGDDIELMTDVEQEKDLEARGGIHRILLHAAEIERRLSEMAADGFLCDVDK